MKIRRVNYSPDEFLAAILSLTVDEIGLYWVACTLIYSKRGPIDADSAWLGRVAGCSSRRARRLIDSLLAKGKLSLDNAGRLTNGRAEQEIKAAKTRSRMAIRGGIASGLARNRRGENRPVSRNPNDLDSKTVQRPRSTIKSHESRVTKDSESDARAGRDREAPRARDDGLKPISDTLAQIRARHRRKP